MAKKRRVWLGRSNCGTYGLGDAKTSWNNDTGFGVLETLVAMCPTAFEEITGVRLKEGMEKPIEVTISIKRVKRVAAKKKAKSKK